MEEQTRWVVAEFRESVGMQQSRLVEFLHEDAREVRRNKSQKAQQYFEHLAARNGVLSQLFAVIGNNAAPMPPPGE